MTGEVRHATSLIPTPGASISSGQAVLVFTVLFACWQGKGNVLCALWATPAVSQVRTSFVLTGGSIPESYPQTTTRIHEVAPCSNQATSNLIPKF